MKNERALAEDTVIEGTEPLTKSLPTIKATDNARLNELIVEQERNIQKLLKKNRDLMRAREDLDQAIYNIVNSHSWKITAPLRSLMALKRNLFPLYRSRTHRMSVKSLHDMEKVGSTFSIEGSNPWIIL